MPVSTRKIINKFIPKTDSHSKSRISKIVQHIQLEANKNKKQLKIIKRTKIFIYSVKHYRKVICGYFVFAKFDL